MQRWNWITFHNLMKSVFHSILGFAPNWEYEPNEYISEKIIDVLPIDKNHLSCHCIDGLILIDVREPILLSFLLENLLVSRFFVKKEQYIIKKHRNHYCIILHLEDDNTNMVIFNVKTFNLISLKL